MSGLRIETSRVVEEDKVKANPKHWVPRVKGHARTRSDPMQLAILQKLEEARFKNRNNSPSNLHFNSPYSNSQLVSPSTSPENYLPVPSLRSMPEKKVEDKDIEETIDWGKLKTVLLLKCFNLLFFLYNSAKEIWSEAHTYIHQFPSLHGFIYASLLLLSLIVIPSLTYLVIVNVLTLGLLSFIWVCIQFNFVVLAGLFLFLPALLFIAFGSTVVGSIYYLNWYLFKKDAKVVEGQAP